MSPCVSTKKSQRIFTDLVGLVLLTQISQPLWYITLISSAEPKESSLGIKLLARENIGVEDDPGT